MTSHNIHEKPLVVEGIESVVDDVATLRCKVALPAGSRVVFTLPGSSLEFLGKVVKLKRLNPEFIGVTVRLNTLTQEHKHLLSR